MPARRVAAFAATAAGVALAATSMRVEATEPAAAPASRASAFASPASLPACSTCARRAAMAAELSPCSMARLTTSEREDTLCAGVPSARQQSSSAVAQTDTAAVVAMGGVETTPLAASSPTGSSCPMTDSHTVTWSKSAGTPPSSVPSQAT